ncbi:MULTISPECIES: SGNH/GDSL hydrolase family protein [unclassified Campylobacter]|uniref:SGNH/GDSL hydrolase family protein n=1 Tax=unclassified Campylobacter TaxID=2593542 RepID=UPI001D95BD5C|nr:SGNH/GDSL hydrolase family protein [Campylobacter sp. RM12651]MBZ7983683.1 SGNH/GDSL hydrolase family protein [Campylobacter sp. RM12647]ULO03509.1 hypothetical protein AVBRAN_1050 [Campylobacter sp. RM12651]
MKVCLIGGSNGVMLEGLQRGLKDTLNSNIVGGGNHEFLNLSLGGPGSAHRLYELTRNIDKIKTFDLVIIDAYLNDFIKYLYSRYNISMIERNAHYLYNELSKLKTKVVSLLISQPLYDENNINHKVIYNIHKSYCNLYDISVVDMQQYMISKNLFEFFKKPDANHPLNSIMRKIGANIIKNYNLIDMPNPNDVNLLDLEFKIINYEDIFSKDSDLVHKNSCYCEKVLRLNKDTEIAKLSKYSGWFIVGIHTWNKDDKLSIVPDRYYGTYSLIKISNDKNNLVKAFSYFNQFSTVQNDFLIDNSTKLHYFDNEKEETEWGEHTSATFNDTCKIDFLDFISLFLCSKSLKLTLDEIYEIYANDIIVNKDLSKILPDVDFAVDVSNEYYEKAIQHENNDSKDLIEIKKILKTLKTFRIDVFMENNHQEFDTNCSNGVVVEYPKWYDASNGKGMIIYNNKIETSDFNLKIKTHLSGKISFKFLSSCVKDKDNNFLPIWVTYDKLTINSKTYDTFSAWHNKPTTIEMDCINGGILDISFRLKFYKYSEQDICNILKKCFSIEDNFVQKIIYSYINYDEE